MFTGIVEELGSIEAIEPGADSARLKVRGPLVAAVGRKPATVTRPRG